MSKISSEDCKKAITHWYESDGYPDYYPRGKFDIRKLSTRKSKAKLVVRAFEMVFYANEPLNLDDGTYVYCLCYAIENADGTVSIQKQHPDEQ